MAYDRRLTPNGKPCEPTLVRICSLYLLRKLTCTPILTVLSIDLSKYSVYWFETGKSIAEIKKTDSL